ADRLLGAGATRLLLDLGAVGFCDSTGLGALVRLHRRTEASGGWLRLAGPGPDLRRMLAVTNLDRLLAVYATVPDAAAAPGDRPAASTPP
ncbi:MAG TPA: STAS domain-containing protein, partial [Catenuloplanes sp.]